MVDPIVAAVPTRYYQLDSGQKREWIRLLAGTL
jgi:hypothetical protein